MGRLVPVPFTLEMVAEWRRLGAEVTFEPGWETRGNGYAANYEGAVVHHTGFGSSEANPFPARNTLLNGRPDLKGPLCNSAGPWCPPDRPRIHVIAANPSNHAGASGGRSMGPLPVTGLFNPRVWGHEIDYGGNVPMSPGQYTAALIFARGLSNVLGRSIEYVRAHAETSITGKWDPGYAPGKTLDMAVFRRDAAAYQGDDMPLNQSDLNAVSVIVKDWVIRVLRDEKLLDWPAESGGPQSVVSQLKLDAQGLASVYRELAALKGAPPATGAALPTEFDLPSFAREIARQAALEVVAEQDRRARDSDPATGPIS